MARQLGIDPGLHGALVVIDTAAATLACARMPTYRETRSNGKRKSFVDEEALATIIRGWLPLDCGWIEDVFAMPEQGAVSMFSFGEGKGILKGVLGALGIPRRYGSPSVWKREMQVSTEPVLITARCNQLFPECRSLLTSEGRREAAMLTLWGCLKDGLAVPLLTPASR